jgi:hypothetical protein
VIAAEFTLDLTVLAPSGRIKVIEGGATRVLASGFFFTGVSVDPRTGEIYAATLGGAILRFPAP